MAITLKNENYISANGDTSLIAGDRIVCVLNPSDVVSKVGTNVVLDYTVPDGKSATLTLDFLLKQI